MGEHEAGQQRLTYEEIFALAKKLPVHDQVCTIRKLLEHLCPDGKCATLDFSQEETIRSLKMGFPNLESLAQEDERLATELTLLREKLTQFRI